MKKRVRLTESELHSVIKESVKRILKEDFEGTDAVDEAVTAASSTIADEYFTQNGLQDVAADHDDSWYELQEELRDAMLEAAFGVCNENRWF